MSGGPLKTGFPTFVNNLLPPRVDGDFSSANPLVSVVPTPGGYNAPAAGALVGHFAWYNPVTKIASNYLTSGSFLGFIHREQQALITQFLGFASMQIPAGLVVNGLAQGETSGEFLAGATVGQKVYADAVTGALTSAATGNGVSGAITSVSVATTGVATVNTITGTPLVVGQLMTAPGIPDGSYIGSLGSGTGGAGTYNLVNVNGSPFVVVTAQAGNYYGAQETGWTVGESIQANVTSTASTISAAGLLTTGGALSAGTIQPGQFVQGPAGVNVPSNVQILYQVSGTAGAGGGATYQTNCTVAVTSQTLTFVGNKTARITSWGN